MISLRAVGSAPVPNRECVRITRIVRLADRHFSPHPSDPGTDINLYHRYIRFHLEVAKATFRGLDLITGNSSMLFRLSLNAILMCTFLLQVCVPCCVLSGQCEQSSVNNEDNSQTAKSCCYCPLAGKPEPGETDSPPKPSHCPLCEAPKDFYSHNDTSFSWEQESSRLQLQCLQTERLCSSPLSEETVDGLADREWKLLPHVRAMRLLL
jgi:hypothetical protein